MTVSRLACAALALSACLLAPALAQTLRPVQPQHLAAHKPALILDVRSAAEFQEGHVPGARNIPHDQMQAQLKSLAAYKDQDIVLYCRSGRRVSEAAQVLHAAGFTRLQHLQGDFPGWAASGQAIQKP